MHLIHLPKLNDSPAAYFSNKTYLMCNYVTELRSLHSHKMIQCMGSDSEYCRIYPMSSLKYMHGYLADFEPKVVNFIRHDSLHTKFHFSFLKVTNSAISRVVCESGADETMGLDPNTTFVRSNTRSFMFRMLKLP